MMDTDRNRWRGWMVALAMASAGGANAQVQAPETVLRGAQVTESALIDALAVDRPGEAVGGKTRSFRPAAPRPADGPAAAQKGRANLLMTFATNSFELTGETRKTLDVVARALQSDALASKSFKIEGHADARGDMDSNHTLSQARAEAVATYLVQQHNIQAGRLVAVGKGSNEPLNASRADAPENRRVTIVTDRN